LIGTYNVFFSQNNGLLVGIILSKLILKVYEATHLADVAKVVEIFRKSNDNRQKNSRVSACANDEARIKVRLKTFGCGMDNERARDFVAG
jgi:hypothetical protein